ncbi:hypothetical protein C4K19_3382 [Pseudomonas chlororaphis subsp. aurantiaca]|nr:hypothetical protein C4K19_3382 [Pseudomonas chlororaphis subsp. aurantiaca]AZD67261.1 hypothetical protein C4K17_3375 [Pseudomonas chlororaphis subsp. aurantiaca]
MIGPADAALAAWPRRENPSRAHRPASGFDSEGNLTEACAFVKPPLPWMPA